MDVTAQWIVNQAITLFRDFNKHTVSIFEISQMRISIRLSSQIKRLVSIWTWTSATMTLVNLPRFVSVPNCPCTWINFKLMLESFSQTPFGWFIIDFKFIITFFHYNISQLKYWLIVISTNNLYNRIGSWMRLH